MTLTSSTPITQENVALKMFGEEITPDSFEARAIAAGHTLVLDDEGEIDGFIFEGHYCNGPGCSTCGWSACHHCNSPIPTCPGLALAKPAEDHVGDATEKVDWQRVGPKLVEVLVNIKAGGSWQGDAAADALAAAQPEGK